MNPMVFTRTDPAYPVRLQERLGQQAPTKLIALGSVALLSQRKTALFCSVRCPGDAILSAYDAAQRLRDEGILVISGFHSSVEKECLRILLRGKQPIIICAARAIDKIRLPSDWRAALEASRLLIMSPFEKRPRRPTTESSQYRNEIVAALSDEVVIVHAEPGGSIERISEMLNAWNIPQRRSPQTR
ncbi:MAG TPA: DNA-processing protein DprA [Candidatus Binatia bacterium]|jgi:predicted Rossmann fold nucleotide-binding protein DprA/Smf involved in DNA uptake